MNKKPLLLTMIPLILIGIAGSFYFQIAFLLQLEYIDFFRIISSMTLPNWITIAFLATTAFVLYRGNALAKFLMPATCVIVFWNNYLVSQYANNYSVLQTFIGSCCMALLFAPLYTKQYRAIFSDRRRQWWNCQPRKAYAAPVIVNPFVSATFNSRTHDFSRSGLFLKLENIGLDNLPKVGQRVKLSISIDTLRKIRCEAEVVRFQEPKGNYPRGMGLKFTELDTENRKMLNSFLNH